MEMGNFQESFDLQAYLSKGVERLVAEAVRATLKNPKESAFLARFALAARAASKKRRLAEEAGEHIPAFLIASITSQCNLHCAGCYSRCNQATVDAEPVRQLSAAEWSKIFAEADELGISFILLAGGEPMLRRDVIEAAGEHSGILFPIFTNGTFLDDRYLALFDRHRNLVPILSIEGERETTNARRGAGVYEKLLANMDVFHKKGLAFGASITVTTGNLFEVTSDIFLKKLSDRGCKAVVFVEYVPVAEEEISEDKKTNPVDSVEQAVKELQDSCLCKENASTSFTNKRNKSLAPGDPEREVLRAAIARLRNEHPEMVYVSFPGDEKSSGGCVAAGRGFFHINAQGGAEPCPFSPYSDSNVRDTSLREALQSRLFRELREGGYLLEDHPGGCTLYEKRAQVEEILQKA